MIWIVGYLVIGMSFALYVPVKQARSRAKIDAMTATDIARIPHENREMFDAAVKALRVNYTTRHHVIGGLLWPTQVIAYIAVEILFAVRRSRNGCDH